MKTFAKGKIITILSLTLTLSVVAACGMLANTYAKYTSQISDNASITVADWKFNTDSSCDVNFNMNLAETVIPSTLANGMIAPGTSGQFDIHMDTENTDTGVDFTIALNTNGNKPANLKFYYKPDGPDTERKVYLDGISDTIRGKISANDVTGLTPTIYWVWDYSTSVDNDSTDTNDAALGKELTATVTITGTQIDPGLGVATTTGYSN